MNFFLVNLLITVVVELFMNAYVVRAFWPQGHSSQRVLLANLFSNPLAQMLFRSVPISMWLVEALVVVFEMPFLMKSPRDVSKAFAASLLLNSSSLAAGFLFQSLITALSHR